LVNKIPRQSMIIKKIERLIIVDGCHSKCAKKILDSLGIKYAGYLNLEYVLKIKNLDLSQHLSIQKKLLDTFL